jgi:tetratricopeptide (TPR) repeat protein
VATALSNLALTLEDGGDPDAAEPLLRRALAIDEAIGAQTSLAVHATNLGILLWKTGRLEEAVTWLSCAAAAAEKSLGPDHPKTRSIRESLDAVASSSESAARRDDWEAP